MRTIKRIKLPIVFTLFITYLLVSIGVSYAQQRPFGDMVIECLAKMKAQPGSPEFNKQSDLCEKYVTTDIKLAAWHKCIAIEANRLDDRISTASDIASAVSLSCEKEFNEYLDTLNVSAEVKRLAIRDRAQATKDVAIKLILIMRASKKTKYKPLKGAFI